MKKLSAIVAGAVFWLGASTFLYALSPPITYRDFAEADAALAFSLSDVVREPGMGLSRATHVNKGTVLSGDLEFPLQIHYFPGVLSDISKGQLLIFLKRDQKSGLMKPVNGLFSTLPLSVPVEELDKGEAARPVIDSYLRLHFPSETNSRTASLLALLLGEAPAAVQTHCWEQFSRRILLDEKWALIQLHCGLHAKGFPALQRHPRRFWRIDHIGVEVGQTDILLSRLRRGILRWMEENTREEDIGLVVEFTSEQQGDYHDQLTRMLERIAESSIAPKSD